MRSAVFVLSSVAINACCSSNLEYDPEQKSYILREPLQVGLGTGRGGLFVSYEPNQEWSYALQATIGGEKAQTTKAIAVVQKVDDAYYDRFIIYGDGRGIVSAPFEFQAPITVTEIYAKDKNLRWPDYVFAPGYELRSLYEVEQYIQRHRHLPGMPSGEEINKSGVPLLTTQAALLQKVEELTLYVISLQKQIDSLRALVPRK